MAALRVPRGPGCLGGHPWQELRRAFPPRLPSDPPPRRGGRRAAIRRIALLLGILLAAGGAPRPVGAAEPRPSPTDLVAEVQRSLSEPSRRDLAFLLHLGWRLERDADAAEVTVFPGRPCSRDSLAAAQAAGDLRIVLPATPTAGTIARLSALLPGLVDGIASRCAWQHRVHDAVGRAVGRLVANTERGRYTFPQFLLFFDFPWWYLAPPSPEWVGRGEVYVANGSPSRAVAAFYEKEIEAECYTAQLIATYATQMELYGPAAFDAAFRPEEIVLGQPDAYLRSPIGQTAAADRAHPYQALLLPPADQGRDPLQALAAHGPRAFSGLTGIVLAPDNDLCNENFTIVSVSPAANEALRVGGLARIRDLAREAVAADAAARAYLASGATVAENRRRVEAILAEPILNEVLVYTHPYGTIPLGRLVKEKLVRKRMAVEAVLYTNGREDGFYRRYREAFGRGLLGGAVPAPGALPPAGPGPGRTLPCPPEARPPAPVPASNAPWTTPPR